MTSKMNFMILLSLAVPAWCGRVMVIPHVTTDNNSFETDVVLENRSLVSLTVTLSAYGDGGERASTTISLQPGTRQTHAANALFNDTTVNFIRLQSQPGLFAGVVYIPKAFPANRTYVEAIDQWSTRWRVFPSNWQNHFDSLVIAGNDCNVTEVTVSQYNNQGVLLAQKEPKELNGSRIIYNLASIFAEHSDSYVQVSATHPVAVMALKGSKDLTRANSFLVGDQAVPGSRFDGLMLNLERHLEAFGLGLLTGNYIYTMQPICFCLLGPATGRFENSKLISLVDNQGEDVALNNVHDYPTVRTLYERIRDIAATEPDHMIVTFNEELHVPMRVYVDENACTDGDEWGYELLSIRSIQSVKEH